MPTSLQDLFGTATGSLDERIPSVTLCKTFEEDLQNEISVQDVPTKAMSLPQHMGRPRPQHSLKASENKENNPHLSRGFATSPAMIPHATSVMQTEGPGLLPKKNLWSQHHGENTPPNSSKVPSSLLGNFLVSKVMRKQHMLGLWCAGWTGSEVIWGSWHCSAHEKTSRLPALEATQRWSTLFGCLEWFVWSAPGGCVLFLRSEVPVCNGLTWLEEMHYKRVQTPWITLMTANRKHIGDGQHEVARQGSWDWVMSRPARANPNKLQALHWWCKASPDRRLKVQFGWITAQIEQNQAERQPPKKQYRGSGSVPIQQGNNHPAIVIAFLLGLLEKKTH